MNVKTNRRPIGARSATWASSIARWLSGRAITPNQLSCLSLVFAGLTAAFLFLAGRGAEWWMWLGAVLGVGGRLLCNLFDGMVAIEFGKKTASGQIFNDFPDRLSDALILIATGYSIPSLPFAHVLGWAAALGAVLTAYTRYLGAACGATQNFCGPMAKQQRMAVVTAAYVACAVFSQYAWHPWLIFGALCLVIAGCVITVLRRLKAIVRQLEDQDEGR